jgi:protein associated with RNAse G/E
MITIVKLDPQGHKTIQYHGEVARRLPHGVIIEARWTLPARDLGYTRFEPGDSFIEYYYTDRWFNTFDIASTHGTRKGWYCNITEPAVIFDNHIEQIDLLLDVWVSATGEPLILDEDEFTNTTMLSDRQREGAQRGLEMLLHLIREQREAFASLAAS